MNLTAVRLRGNHFRDTGERNKTVQDVLCHPVERCNHRTVPGLSNCDPQLYDPEPTAALRKPSSICRSNKYPAGQLIDRPGTTNAISSLISRARHRRPRRRLAQYHPQSVACRVVRLIPAHLADRVSEAAGGFAIEALGRLFLPRNSLSRRDCDNRIPPSTASADRARRRVATDATASSTSRRSSASTQRFAVQLVWAGPTCPNDMCAIITWWLTVTLSWPSRVDRGNAPYGRAHPPMKSQDALSSGNAVEIGFSPDTQVDVDRAHREASTNRRRRTQLSRRASVTRPTATIARCAGASEGAAQSERTITCPVPAHRRPPSASKPAMRRCREPIRFRLHELPSRLAPRSGGTANPQPKAAASAARFVSISINRTSAPGSRAASAAKRVLDDAGADDAFGRPRARHRVPTTLLRRFFHVGGSVARRSGTRQEWGRRRHAGQ